LCGIEDQGPKHDDWQTTRESHLIEKPDWFGYHFVHSDHFFRFWQEKISVFMPRNVWRFHVAGSSSEGRWTFADNHTYWHNERFHFRRLYGM
jgi:hypothetical protein